MIRGKKQYTSRKCGKIDSRSKYDKPLRQYGAHASQEEIDICLECEEANCNGKCKKVQKYRYIH